LRYQKCLEIKSFLSDISVFLFLLSVFSLAIFRKNKLIVLISIVLILLILLEFIFYPTSDYLSILNPLAKFLVPGASAEIVKAVTTAPSGMPSYIGNLTTADLDLHAYTSDGLHTGLNYTTGIYENQIPGAIASGDMVSGEWIFVLSNLSVHFVVDGRKVQQYLDEINSSENLTLNYSIQQMVYGLNPSVEFVNDTVNILDRFVSEPVNGSIGPGEEVVYWPSTTSTTTTTTSTTSTSTTTTSTSTTTTTSTTSSTTTTTTTSTSSTTTSTTTTSTTTIPSSCFDGVKNNGESGVDCGTVCNKTCCSYSTTCGGGLCCKKVSHSSGVCCSQGQTCNVVVGNPYCS
jgi:NADH:ubiquinone oxidoreductase subunit K